MSASDLRCRLRNAQKSVASWLSTSGSSGGGGSSGKRISTPQLVKRHVHVTFDRSTGVYQGVPTLWKSEFDNLDKNQEAASVPAASPEAKSTLVAATKEEDRLRFTVEMSSDSSRGVWFDSSTRRFVNLPRHWRERIERNTLFEWTEFEKNPQLLVTVFTLIDEELKKMDLASIGLDQSMYSSPANACQNGTDSSHQEDSPQRAYSSPEEPLYLDVILLSRESNPQVILSSPQEENHQNILLSPQEENSQTVSSSQQEFNHQSEFPSPPENNHKDDSSSRQEDNNQELFSLPNAEYRQNVFSPQADNRQNVFSPKEQRHQIVISSLRNSNYTSVFDSSIIEESLRKTTVGNEMHSQHESDPGQVTKDPVTPTISATGGNDGRSNRSLVWTQQRSFVKDDESDSEEFVEL